MTRIKSDKASRRRRIRLRARNMSPVETQGLINVTEPLSDLSTAELRDMMNDLGCWQRHEGKPDEPD